MSKAALSILPRHLAASISVVLVVGAGTYANASEPGRAGAAFAAMLLSLAPAVLWQAAMVGLERVLGPRLFVFGERGARFVSRDPSAPRGPVVLLHALLAALLVWLLATAGGSKLLLLRLRSLEKVELRESLAVVGIAGIALVALGIAALALIGLRMTFAALDRRWRLPLPPSAALRVILWFGLPVCALALTALYALQKLLGPLAAPLWIPLILGVQIVLHAALPARRAGERAGKLRVLRWSILPLLALALWGADRVLASSSDATAELEGARPGSLLLRGARAATDFDRDGASSLFGELDCAAFSSKRGPLTRDIAGNGIDENCDGTDEAPGTVPAAPIFYGGLRSQDSMDYDIVWFVIDAVRADHTSLLGYKHQTTPNLVELGAESVVFSKAYSQSSATMLSIPSMLTGIDPGRLVWTKEKRRMQVEKDQRQYISVMLASKGYRTGMATVTYFKNRLPGLLDGYDWVGYGSNDDRTAARTAAAQAANFITKARLTPDPYLLVTYLSSPHAPYYPHREGYPRFPRSETTNYDLEIVSADRHLGFVLDVLRSDPERWAKTIVVVTSDHGEEFREHGEMRHANNCHVESLHVPLVLRIPGLGARKVERPVGLVDIVPTLLELVGARAAAPRELDGSSLLFHTHAPERVHAERPLFCTIVNQKHAQGDFARRSVQTGKWKLMTELRSAKPMRLYDIEADPRETAPIALAGEPQQIASRLDAWLRTQLTGNVHLIDMSME